MDLAVGICHGFRFRELFPWEGPGAVSHPTWGSPPARCLLRGPLGTSPGASLARMRVSGRGREQASPAPCRFFEALEQRHKAQVCVEDISDILEEHAERHFHPYVIYCSNELYQQRALQRLT